MVPCLHLKQTEWLSNAPHGTKFTTTITISWFYFWSNTWNYNIIGDKETDQFRLSDAQMHQSSWLVLASILATHQFSAKPQHEAMQTYLHQNPHKHIFVKLSSEFRHFYQRRFENISYKFPSMLSKGQRVPHSFHPPGASLRSRMFQVCWALSQWTARG